VSSASSADQESLSSATSGDVNVDVDGDEGDLGGLPKGRLRWVLVLAVYFVVASAFSFPFSLA
jgi:hypothetical protein